MFNPPDRPPRDRRSFQAKPKLRETIQTLGVTHAAIARDLSSSNTQIGDVVHGRARVKIERAERIASYLGRPVFDLFEPVPGSFR